MIIESLLIIGFAILLDLKFGDPKNKYHPTVWIGTLIAKLTPMARSQYSIIEKLGGICIVMIICVVVVELLFLLNVGIYLITRVDYYIFLIVSVIVGAALLKTTIAIRGMEQHAKSILMALDDGNLEMARTRLAMIVKRDTENLDEEHIISGVLESTSENTVDGVTGPLFYYALAGLPGAFVYRVINTADSMIGYKTQIFKNVGWFAATCDSILNYIPSRLTGLVMIIAAALLQNNWKESYKIMIRDGKNTPSLNAGYPMAALAGALGIKFEKIDHYKLGDEKTVPRKEHIHCAISIMKLSSILFFGIITIPIIYFLSLARLWMHA